MKMQVNMFWIWLQTHGKMSIYSAFTKCNSIVLSKGLSQRGQNGSYDVLHVDNHCLPILEGHIKSKNCNTDGESQLSTSLSSMAPWKILPIVIPISLKHNTNN